MVLKCEKCGAMYIISDEKLKAQDWKFKCSKCQHETVIKPEEKPAQQQVPPPEERIESSPVFPPEIQKHYEHYKSDPKSKSFLPVAEYYFKEGKFEDALKIVDEGLKYNPGYITAHILRGRVLFQLNRIEESIQELENVCNQSKENTVARKLLARAYDAIGKYDEAENSLEIVLMFEPGDTEAKELLHTIKSKREETEKSLVETTPESQKPVEEMPETAQEQESLISEQETTPREEISELKEEGKAEQTIEDIFSAPEGVLEEKEEKTIDSESPGEDLSEISGVVEEPQEGGMFEEPAGEGEPASTELFSTPEAPETVEKQGEEEIIPPEEGKDLFAGEETAVESEGNAELPEDLASFPADREIIPEKPLEEEITEEPAGIFEEHKVEEEKTEQEEVKITEEKLEGLDTGRFDEGVTSEGVIEDVFKPESEGEGEGFQIETEVKKEPQVSEEEAAPQIDEEVLAEQRAKVEVQEAKPVAMTISALKKEKEERRKIKPIFFIVPLVLIIIAGGAGYYYWTFEYVNPTTATIDKLIKVSKGIIKSSDKSRMEAERFFTEAIIKYNLDSIDGYLASVELFKKAIASDPHNPVYFAFLSEAFSRLATITGNNKLLEDAHKIAIRAQEMAPQSPDSLRAVAHYYKASGKEQEAMEYLKKAISTKPDDIYASWLYAELMANNPDKLGDAENILKSALTKKEIPALYSSLGRVYERMGRFEDAIGVYKKVLNEFLHSNSFVSLINLLKQKEDYSEMEAIFNNVSSKIKTIHPDEQKKLLLTEAEVYLDRNDLARAKQILEQVLKIAPQDISAYELLGKIAAQQNNLDEAASYFEKVIQTAPKNSEVNYQCGLIYTKLHKYTQAINKFKTAIDIKSDEYRYHNALGNAFVLNGQLDEGIQELKKALEIAPQSVEVMSNLVEAYLQKGLIDDALAIAQRAVSIDPYSVDARISLSTVYLNSGRNSQAKDELMKVIKLKPLDGKPYKLMVKILIDEGDLKNADEYAEKAIELSGDAESYRINARVKFLTSRFNDALTSIKKAISLEPYNHELFYELGEIYYKDKQLENALKSFQDAVNLSPSDVRSNYMIGIVLESMNKTDDALLQYEKIINKIDDKFAPAYFRMGLIAEKKGDLQKAVSRFQKASEIDNTQPEYLYRLGRIQYLLNDVTKAKENLENASKLAPQNSEIHLYLGMCHDYLGDTENALKEYSLSFKFDPANVEPLVRSASIYRIQGDYNKAMELLSKAIKINPRGEIIYYGLGLLYEERSEIEKAINNYKKAIELKPDYPDPYYSLGFIYFKLGKNTEARENFNKSLSLGIDSKRAKKVKETLSKIP